MAAPRIGLDNSTFAGRRRIHERRSAYERRAALPVKSRLISDVRLPAKPTRPAVRQQSSVRVTVPSPSKASHANATLPAVRQLAPTHARQMPSRVLKREAFRRPPHHKRRFSKPRRSNILTVLALFIVVSGLGVGMYGFRANHDVAVQAKQLAKKQADDSQSADVPSETKPSAGGPYRVAPDLPRTLSIPKLGVKQARVLRMGVDGKNQLKAPGNIFDTGWYDGSSKPGEGGAVLIDGHVSGPTQHGVFYGLKSLVAGDQIQVERGDGKIFTYKVVSSKTYDANAVDMAAALVPIVAGKPGLNLITCAGQLDASKTHFNQRTIVFATQV